MCWRKQKKRSKRALGVRLKENKIRSFITHQMMNPECTVQSWHQLSTHCLALHSSVLPHTKPISTLYWQAIQWGKRNTDGLWLAAFCRLSVFQKPLALPDSWQDFVMEICDGQNSTKTLFLAFICRNDFMLWVKTEYEGVYWGIAMWVCVCVWDIYDWGTSTGPWLRVPFDWAARVLLLKQAG